MSSTEAVSQWYSLGPRGLITCVAKTKTAVFAGYLGGGVYVSSDGGSHWLNASSGLTSYEVKSLATIGDKVFAATDGKGVFVSTNNGTLWTPVNDYLISWHVAGLTSIDTLLLAGPVNYGVFYSSNYGERWYPGGPGLSTGTVNLYFQKDSVLFAGTNSRGVFRSLDLAKTWTAASAGLPNGSSITGFARIGTALLTAAAFYGIFRSDDNGYSWRRTITGLGDKGVTCLGCLTLPGQAAQLYAGSAAGGLFASYDTGTSWQSVSLGSLSSNLIGALGVVDSTIILGIGQAVTLSTDGGKNWKGVGSGLLTAGVNALLFAGSNLYAGTGLGGVYISPDSGGTWSLMNDGLGNLSVTALAARGTTVYAGTDAGVVYRRSPADKSWIDISGITFARQSLHTLTVYKGTLLAAPGQRGVYYSTDDGASWLQGSGSQDVVTGTQVVSFAADEQFLYAGANGQGIYRSSDNGKSWGKFNSGLADLHVQSLAASADSILLAGTATGIYVSSDQGLSWQWRNMLAQRLIGYFNVKVKGGAELERAVSRSVTSLLVLDSQNMIVAGTLGHGTYVSNDGGRSWHDANSGIISSTVRVLATDQKNAYAGVAYGGVYKQTLRNLSQLPGLFESTPAAHSPSPVCLQIFPNPFNPTTKISFTLPSPSRVELSVYNILGALVAKPLAEDMSDGPHEVTFRAEHLASGVYICRIRTNQGVRAVKMLLTR